MSSFGPGDMRRALDLVASLSEDTGTDPVPTGTLLRLQELTDADSAVGYVEVRKDDQQAHEWVTRPAPVWLQPVLARIGTQDPLHAVHRRPAQRALCISDFLSTRQFERLEIYEQVCEPLAARDSLRLYLRGPVGVTRFLFFDRSSRGFSAHARTLVEILGPHIERAANEHLRAPKGAAGGYFASLTPTERHIGQLVSTGLRNADVAAQLHVSVKAVEQHLTAVYRKLDVRSRVELSIRWNKLAHPT